MPTKADWDDLNRRITAIEKLIEEWEGDVPPNALGVLHVLLRVMRRGGKWRPADTTSALTSGSSLERIFSELRTETALEREQKRHRPGER